MHVIEGHTERRMQQTLLRPACVDSLEIRSAAEPELIPTTRHQVKHTS